MSGHTPGPWKAVQDGAVYRIYGPLDPVVGNLHIADVQIQGSETAGNATILAIAPQMLEALKAIEFLFQRPHENSVERFERIAAQFHAETGLLAPGKDVPMAAPDIGADRQTYDEWVECTSEACPRRHSRRRTGAGMMGERPKLLIVGDQLSDIWLGEGGWTVGKNAKSITVDRLEGPMGWYLVAVVASGNFPDIVVPLHSADQFTIATAEPEADKP